MRATLALSLSFSLPLSLLFCSIVIVKSLVLIRQRMIVYRRECLSVATLSKHSNSIFHCMEYTWTKIWQNLFSLRLSYFLLFARVSFCLWRLNIGFYCVLTRWQLSILEMKARHRSNERKSKKDKAKVTAAMVPVTLVPLYISYREKMQSTFKNNIWIEQSLSFFKCRLRWTRAVATVDAVDFAKLSQLLSIHIQMR